MNFLGGVNRKLLLYALIAALVSPFALLVWPTPYRYDHIDPSQGQSYPTRTNRFSGHTEILLLDGWKDLGSVEANDSLGLKRYLTKSEISKLKVQPRVEGIGPPRGWDYLEADVYNGLPDLTVSEITLEVTVLRPNGERVVDSRRYRLTDMYGIPPLETGSLSAALGFNILPGQSWSYALIGAKGKRN